MRYCSLCKKKKEENFCIFCGKNTKNDYVLNVTVGKFKIRLPLIMMKYKGPGFKKFFSKVKVGWEDAHGEKRDRYPEGVNKYMKIDRKNDKYREHITDCRTGEVIRDKNEPLKNHVPENQQKL